MKKENSLVQSDSPADKLVAQPAKTGNQIKLLNETPTDYDKKKKKSIYIEEQKYTRQ